MATQYDVHHLERVASTQDEARRRFTGRPCLVTAALQDVGRGRSGAEWLNATRALAVSLAFETWWPLDRVPLTTLVAGLSARRVLGERMRLKWPNDVVDEAGEKVAGLLAERTDELLVVGMGVNLYWPDAPAGMGALRRDDPGPGAGPELAIAWAEDLLARLVAGPDAFVPAEYEQACATIGATVTWDGGGPSPAVGIDSTGGLIVDDGAGGRQVLRSGRVRQVRTTTLPD